MIRFRLGRSWEREGAAEEGPRDAFSLLVDGIDVLSGASEEPLLDVMEGVANLLPQLASSEESVAELSLPDSHKELVLWRNGDALDLAVVSLERPARIVKGPLEVDVHAFLAGAKEAVAAFASKLRETGREEAARKIEKAQRKKPSVRGASAAKDAPSARGDSSPLAFGFVSHGKRPKPSALALSSLLVPGELFLESSGDRLWSAPGVPFLFALELSRQGFDLIHAIETGMAEFSFSPGGLGPPLVLSLADGKLTLPSGAVLSAAPADLCRALFAVGVATDAAFATGRTRPVPLRELAARCHEGLAALRPPSPPPLDEGMEDTVVRPLPRAEALESRGTMRALRLESLFETVSGVEPAAIVLSVAGPVVVGATFASHVAEDGAELERFEGPHGVAVSVAGWVLVGKEAAIHGHRLGVPGARFLRTHEPVPLGAELHEVQGHLVTASARSVLSIQLPSGREAWRYSPGRTQKLQLGMVPPYAMVSTEGGQLLALDVRTGEAAFRIRAGVPFMGPAQPARGGRALVRLGHPNQVAVIAAELAGGQLAMNADVKLSLSSPPLPSGRGFFVAGEREKDGVLLYVDERGKPKWEKRLHLGHGPFALLGIEGGVAVSARDGGLVVFEQSGEIRFRVGGGDARLEELVAPVRLGDVLFAPGATVRALGISSGEVLGELQAPSLLQLCADEPKRVLYTLETTGRLRGFAVGTRLAVVDEAEAASAAKKKGPKRTSRSGPKKSKS